MDFFVFFVILSIFLSLFITLFSAKNLLKKTEDVELRKKGFGAIFILVFISFMQISGFFYLLYLMILILFDKILSWETGFIVSKGILVLIYVLYVGITYRRRF